MKAFLKNYRQSPRKVRLVANLIKGKSTKDAKAILQFNTRKASQDLMKLLASAEANAINNNNASSDSLKVKSVMVDAGITMKRFRPGWRGTAFPYKKRTSSVALELEVVAPKEAKVKKTEAKSKVINKAPARGGSASGRKTI